jgi:hypothetical protein
MPQPNGAPTQPSPKSPNLDEMDSVMNEVFDGLSADIDKFVKGE